MAKNDGNTLCDIAETSSSLEENKDAVPFLKRFRASPELFFDDPVGIALSD